MLLFSEFLQEGHTLHRFSQLVDPEEPLSFTEQFCEITFYKACFRTGVDQKIEMDKVTFRMIFKPPFTK